MFAASLFLLGSHVAIAHASAHCPLLGVTLPPLQHPSNDAIIQAAAANITTQLQQLLAAGGYSDGKTTSMSVNGFSIQDTESLFHFDHTADISINATVGTTNVDGDTIFRIGSVSKLMPVYLFLIKQGFVHFNDPITNYIPELAAAVQAQGQNGTGDDGAFDHVQWDEVTIGALASQSSGIGRDDLFSDLSGSDPTGIVSTAKLPQLPLAEVVTCGASQSQPLCDRNTFFKALTRHHPVFPTHTTPIYSNMAYQLLGYALENVTGRPFESLFDETIKGPLNLSRSSYKVPADESQGMIPIGLNQSGWNQDIGDEGPAGNFYMSSNDLSSLGRAILNSSLLTPAHTRQWLRPMAHTGSLKASVGAPWEISRMEVAGRIVDYYTKEGDIGVYAAGLYLIPEFNAGFALVSARGKIPGSSGNATAPTATTNQTLVAAANTTTTTAKRATNQSSGASGNSTAAPPTSADSAPVQPQDLIKATFVAALDAAGKAQAAQRFGGVYSAAGSNSSSMSITTDDGPGLVVNQWNYNGTDMLSMAPTIEHMTAPSMSMRLYDTRLGSASGRRLAFRAVFTPLPLPDSAAACISWIAADVPTYGGAALDDFVLELDAAGNAASIRSRMLRTVYTKQ